MIRHILRWLLAAFYAFAGYVHLANPAPFLSIMPTWVPAPEAVVLWTGIAELLGAAALAQCLALYAVCVFPANIHHFALDLARPDGGLGLGYHAPRMIAQPLVVWLALWTGGVTDWPLRRR